VVAEALGNHRCRDARVRFEGLRSRVAELREDGGVVAPFVERQEPREVLVLVADRRRRERAVRLLVPLLLGAVARAVASRGPRGCRSARLPSAQPVGPRREPTS
jgi:hypothetical protein